MFCWFGNILVNTDRIVFVRVANTVAEVSFGNGAMIQVDAEGIRPVLDALAVDMTPDNPEPERSEVTAGETAELDNLLQSGYEWVAMDSTGFVHGFSERPVKRAAYWECDPSGRCLVMRSHLLDGAAWLSWDSPEPVHIPTLLEVDY